MANSLNISNRSLMALFLNRDKIWKQLRRSSLAQPFLFVCSSLYAFITKTRLKLYQTQLLKSHNPGIPTICIGNISVGGTGKTPLVAYLAKELSGDLPIGILTRGYGGQVGRTKPHLAIPDSSASLIGDEGKLYQLLLKDNPPLLAISADRVAGVNLLAKAGAKICIMDDGLQHFRINPDIKICLIDISDASEYFNAGTASLLPAGIFRESPGSAFSRIDRVVFTSKNKVSEKEKETIRRLSNHLKVLTYSIIEFRATLVRDGFSGEIKKIEENKTYSLLSAIAKPEPLVLALNELGAKLSQTTLLPDHHLFTESEWIRAHQAGTVLCSGKDWVKLIPFLKKEGELLVLEQEVIDLSDPGEELLCWLKKHDKLVLLR